MNRLPLELTVKIFSQLNLNDLKTLRLVCKKFEDIVREVKIRELIVQKEYSRLNYELWFSTSELKESGAHLSPKCFLSAFSLWGGPFNFRFLRRLFIESLSEAKGIELEDINQLQHLEHLEIGFDQPPRKSSSMCSLSDHQLQKQVRQATRLSLPNLKVLRIISFFNQRPGIEIDAPNLKVLQLPDSLKYFDAYIRYKSYHPAKLRDIQFLANARRFFYEPLYQNDMSSLNFKHSENIKCLSMWNPEQFFENPNFVRSFRNVEHLLVSDSWLALLTPFLDAILETLEKLKIVDLQSSLTRVNLRDVIHVVDWVAALQKPELKVYLMGIQITNNPNFVKDFTFYRGALQKEKEVSLSFKDDMFTLTMQLKNYSLLSDRIDKIYHLRYNDQIEKLLEMRADQDGQFPTESSAGDPNESVLFSLFPVDFFDRFPGITGISAERIENEDHFTQLVKNIKNLRSLILKNSKLSQAFFDQLPATSLLNRLEIIEETKELSMSFLSRMNHLNICITDQHVNPKIVLRLVRIMDCRSLYLYCYTAGRFMLIRRDASDKPRRWRLQIYWFKKVVSFKSLADYLFERKVAHHELIIFNHYNNIVFKLLGEVPVSLRLKFWFCVGGFGGVYLGQFLSRKDWK